MRQIALIIAAGLVIATIYYGFREMQKVHIRLDHMSKVVKRLEDSRSELEGKIEFQQVASHSPNIKESTYQSSQNSSTTPTPNTPVTPNAQNTVNITTTANTVNNENTTNNSNPVEISHDRNTTQNPKPTWNIENALTFWKGYNEGTQGFQPAITDVFKVFCQEEFEGKLLSEPVLLKDKLILLLEAVGQCDRQDISEDEKDIVFNQFDRNQSGAVEFSDFLYTMALRRQKNMGLDTPPPILRQQKKTDELEISSDQESCEIEPESMEGVSEEIQEQINNLHPIPTVRRDENEVDSLADISETESLDEDNVETYDVNVPSGEPTHDGELEKDTVHYDNMVENSFDSHNFQEGDVASVDSSLEIDSPEECEEDSNVNDSDIHLSTNSKEIPSEDSEEKVMIQEHSGEQEEESYTNVFLESLTVKELKELAKKKSIPTNKRRKGELINMIMGTSV